MADQLEIHWSAKAVRDLDNIFKYLELTWTQKEVTNFTSKLNKALALISKRPKLFSLTNYRKNLRRCVLNKQTTIYYQERDAEIFIIALFDNRQDPAKRP